jgi:endonuclease YncB( thermonuclease family)
MSKVGVEFQVRSTMLKPSAILNSVLISLLMYLYSSDLWATICRHSEDGFNCVEYIENYDGDTFTVNLPDVHHFFGSQIPIRILGIDAPERRASAKCEKELAEKARNYTHMRLSKAFQIELRNLQRDKYFRVLADVYVDGAHLGSELIRKRLAISYDGEKRPVVNWCHFR